VVLEHLRVNEVNRSVEHRLDASGKGINVTRVLTQLGERATHLCQAGGWNRELWLGMAKLDDLEVHWVESETPIRFCTTLVDRSTHAATEIVEAAEPVPPTVEARVLEAFERLLADHRVVIWSGTKAAGFTAELFPVMVERAKRAGAMIVLDVRGSDLVRSLRHGPDVIKPNFSEFVGTFLGDQDPGEHAHDPQIEARARQQMSTLRREHGCDVVLTRGARSTLFTADDEVAELDPPTIQPLNPIGSGDAFTAGLAAALARGRPLVEAVAHGHHCGCQNARLLRPGVIR
jgi:1-phosphofructokinase/tagatose 6-phosphate kinase